MYAFIRSAGICTLIGVCCLSHANANELVYEPVNPSFGGNPFNSGHLQFLANSQNKFKSTGSTQRSGTGQSSTADLFVRNLQSRLISSLAGQVADAIFGENPSDAGTVVFGDTEVTFVRGVEFISLSINDPSTGITEIQVPILSVE